MYRQLGGNIMTKFKDKSEMVDALYDAIHFIRENYPDYTYAHALALDLENVVVEIREEINE